MYVILVYDVGVERVDKVRKFLKRYLKWVQNSVFEGEITESELMKVQNELKDLLEKDEDNVRIYRLWDKKYLKLNEIGESKAETDQII